MWEELLAKAIHILEGSNIPKEEWTWGGGTALAFYNISPFLPPD